MGALKGVQRWLQQLALGKLPAISDQIGARRYSSSLKVEHGTYVSRALNVQGCQTNWGLEQ